MPHGVTSRPSRAPTANLRDGLRAASFAAVGILLAVPIHAQDGPALDFSESRAIEVVTQAMRSRGMNPPPGAGIALQDYVEAGISNESREARVWIGPEGRPVPDSEWRQANSDYCRQRNRYLEPPTKALQFKLHRYGDEYRVAIQYVDVATGRIENQRMGRGAPGEAGLQQAVEDAWDQLRVSIGRPTTPCGREIETVACSRDVMESAFEASEGGLTDLFGDSLHAVGNRLGMDVAGLFSDSMRDASIRELGPLVGPGELSLSGSVSDDGAACTMPLAFRRVPRRAEPGEQVSEEEVVRRVQEGAARAMARMERAAREVFGKSMREMTQEDWENATPEQKRRYTEIMGMSELMKRESWREKEGDVLITLFSPHSHTWITGILNFPQNTVHGGVGGWGTNAASLIKLWLRGTSAAELEERKTYPAEAYAAPSVEEAYASSPSERMVHTHHAFYTRWNGPVSYRLTGKLTGTVTIEHITPVEVIGTFEVSGPATVHFREQVDRREVKRWTEAGDVTFRGEFSAPTERRPYEEGEER